MRAVVGARKAIAKHGSEADVILIHDPELLLVIPGHLRDRVVWDVHEDLEAALVDKPWLPASLRPLTRRVVTYMKLWAENRMKLVLAEEGYQPGFRREHPVVPNDPWVPADFERTVQPKVVHLGRHSRGRGAAELVALAQGLPQGISLTLLGPADSEIEEDIRGTTANPRVTWTGRIRNEAALSMVDGAVAGLSLLHDLPNYRHSRPTKILEYMSRGVPVVTTPLPQAVEIVEQYRCGIVVPFGDVDAVIEAVDILAAHPDRRMELGQNGHKAADEHFNWRKSGQEFVSLLEGWAATR